MPHLYVFRFYIDDADPESIMFGCTAASLADAEMQTRAAGYQEFTLFDQRPVEAEEGHLAALARIDGHPFLGPEWAPLVGVIAEVTQTLTVGRFWGLDTYAGVSDFDPYRSPFVQAMLEADGSLHVEVAGRDELNSPTRPDQYAQLELLGWTAPADADLSADAREGRLPNSYRIFEPGWNAQGVAEVFLEALTVVFGITADDFFTFGEENADLVASLKLMDWDGGAIFSLPGRHPRPSSQEGSVGNVDEGMFLGDFSASGGIASANLGLPDTIGPDIAKLIIDMCASDEIDLPYIPDEFGGDLVNFDDANFGMDYSPFDSIDFYGLREPLRQLRDGEWEPRVQFGLAGHGMNSYAWTYLLVSDGVAILGQAGRGVAFPNPDQTRKEWSTLIAGARLVHAAALEHGRQSGDRLLLVVYSPMRSLATWRWLVHGEPLGDDASDEMEVDGGPEIVDSDLFSSAVTEALGGPPKNVSS